MSIFPDISAGATANGQAPASKLDAALAMVERGFNVFRLRENGKRPAAGGWQDEATRNAGKLRKLWTRREEYLNAPAELVELDHNIGIATGTELPDGGYLFVVDVDDKNGKAGSDALKKLEAEHGELPDTFAVRTPTGGRHLYFRAAERLSGKRLGDPKDGLDTRCAGQLVAGPGSTIDGKAYEIVTDAPIASLPVWIADQMETPRERDPDAPTIAIDLSTGQPIELNTSEIEKRAIKYLTVDVEPAIENSGGDEQTCRVVERLGDLGCSEHFALGLMSEYFNPRCSPPWEFADLEVKCRSRYTGRQEPIGWDSPEAQFPMVRTPNEIETTNDDQSNRQRLRAERGAAIRIDAQRKYLIKGLFDQESTSVIFGAPNVGKSFVALDAAMHVATGMSWRGCRTTKMGVMYIAAEGAQGFPARVVAWRNHHGNDDVPTFALVRHPVDLRHKEGHTDELIELIREEESAMGVKIGWVIIDTLARALAGGDESSSVDMGLAINNMDRIRQSTSTAVTFVHHSGKDESRGARGHSSLLGAIDAEIEIKKDRIVNSKQREMAKSGVLGFRLETVPLGQDQDGDAITSCIAIPASLSSAEDDFGDVKVTKKMREAWTAAQKLESEMAGSSHDPFADVGPWLLAADWASRWTANNHTGTYHRTKDSLTRAGKIEVREDGKAFRILRPEFEEE